ncbi:MAG: flagellar export chaperone FliS [Firmicutes bacterium]|nr:flagellar export chaperone FliS [Bacillota bacterium]
MSVSYAQQAARQYRTTQVSTAGPMKLVLMLYDGAIRFVNQAAAAVESNKLEEAHRSLLRAQDILAELDGALDRSAGEIAENLHRLYDYMQRRLIEGNVRKDPEPLREVAGLLEQLQEAWQAVAQSEGGSAHGRPARA